MWDELLRAFCLVLILEGIMPFLYPRRWRRMVTVLATASNRQLRVSGLVSMLIGVSLLYLVH